MNTLKEFWWWIDGNKTTIGAVFMFFGIFITEVVLGIWQAEATWIPKLASTFNWLGAAITSVGLTHKGYKTATQ